MKNKLQIEVQDDQESDNYLHFKYICSSLFTLMLLQVMEEAKKMVGANIKIKQ